MNVVCGCVCGCLFAWSVDSWLELALINAVVYTDDAAVCLPI